MGSRRLPAGALGLGDRRGRPAAPPALDRAGH